MESPEYLLGGYHRVGGGGGGGLASQLGAEKQGDHFVVEDLLDFSNEDEDEEEAFVCADAYETIAGNSADSSSASVITAVDSCNSSLSGHDARFPAEFRLSGDLSEPAYDELAELEWITNLGEETFSSEDIEKLHLISGIKPSSEAAPPPSSVSETPARGRARSKRSRAANVSWSSRLPILSSSSSESDAIAAPPPKPVKKKEAAPAAAVARRKCLHCEAEETPQWRAGPMGPKTLCNACGVRYKSGRLVPEYRPAASPTFIVSEHSNSHRKVLQLRRQKEQQQPLQLHLRRRPEELGNGGGDEFLIHDHIGIDFRELI
ncbi:hypothetical protein J5N97_012888 [Dioscorea zingiberensis]|uniref:GATA transcription factor n=1 Tax=Dioscorea zingiberensis TaxID=325984 RepID=A0A9D5CR44_9LILI|nr:hypothetical protein J5N97_012888 [Dioscorea zingiberensis]